MLILTKEISLILPTFPTERKEKRSIIASIVTGFIGLAYEGISSFLLHRRQKSLHKVFMAMENKVNLERIRVFYIEDSMVMYAIYNSDTLEQSINIVHKMHNKTTWNEKLFVWHIWNSGEFEGFQVVLVN